MKRRTLLSMTGAAAVAGCGFQLRQAPSFAFDTIFINAPASSPIAHELRRNLTSDSRIRVLNTATEQPPPQVILEVPLELREKVVVGLNASGQVREYQLRSRLQFRLRTPQGRELIPDTELLQQRDISFSESLVLAKESEETLLYRDMQSDLVQQLMRRLAAIKAL